MPFPMTHLAIAINILQSTPQIQNPSDFILGSIAPDSVHFRENYNSDMKKKSHLCVGDEKWGRVTNNLEWQTSVLSFLECRRNDDNIDFIYGYCIHILTDIQNNIHIWTPFLSENKEALEVGMGSIYHKESHDIDYELYLLNPKQKEIWKLLSDSLGYDIPNVVVQDEISKMKHELFHQYINRATSDLTLNKYVTLSRIQDFICTESQYIRNLVFNYN